jgi:hypothetical protein
MMNDDVPGTGTRVLSILQKVRTTYVRRINEELL